MNRVKGLILTTKCNRLHHMRITNLMESRCVGIRTVFVKLRRGSKNGKEKNLLYICTGIFLHSIVLELFKAYSWIRVGNSMANFGEAAI